MNLNPNPVLLIALSAVTVLSGAEIYARKMEVVRIGGMQAMVLRESVAISDRGTVICSRNAQLSPGRDRAVLWDSVWIKTSEVYVQADSVEYDFSQRHSRLYARPGRLITVQEESVEIRAPVLEYSFVAGRIQAPAGLELRDRRGEFVVNGKRGCYFLKSRQGMVDSEPILTINPEQQETEVEVTATTMDYNDVEGQFRASGNVRVRSGAGELVCDSAVFHPAADSGVAWGSPKVKDSSGSAEGDTVVFYLKDQSLRQVALHGRAKGRYRTNSGETVLVNGSQLSMELADGKIDVIEVANLISGQLIRRGSAERIGD
ncbi:MAG: hypothetical protein ABIK38_06420 [candidate division WOR-3 bacterium]